MPTSSPITVAIVGLGRAGWDIHAIALLRGRKDYRLVECVDVMPERLDEARQAFGCKTFLDFDQFIKVSEAELVVIATKSMDHCRMTCAALAAGKHVVVEKPMAMSVREADRMIAMAKRARRVLTVHQSTRYGPEALRVMEVLDSGILGKVVFLRLGGYGFARRADWQMLRKFGGGQLANWGSHMIDQALTMAKRPVTHVCSELRHTVGAGDADDHIKILMRTDKGPTIDIELTNACAFPQAGYLALGTCGTMECRDGKCRVRWFDPRALPKIRASEVLTHRRYGSDERIPWQEKEMPAQSDKRVDFYENLFGAIRRGRKLLITPDSSREVVRIQDVCRRQNREL